MSDRGTEASIIDRYNSVLARDAWFDPARRAALERSFERRLAPWLPADKDAALLDVACGEGALLGFLRGRGYRTLSGFDLSAENVRLCHDQGLAFVEQHDALDVERFEPGRRYAVVFLLDLIEHLPKDRVVPFLRAVASRVDPGGSIVIQTPNMGSLLGAFARYSDVTHAWGVTERSVVDLLVAAGFERPDIEVRPAWDATTVAGRAREAYLRVLHRAIFLAQGRTRPRVASAHLLVRGIVR